MPTSRRMVLMSFDLIRQFRAVDDDPAAVVMLDAVDRLVAWMGFGNRGGVA